MIGRFVLLSVDGHVLEVRDVVVPDRTSDDAVHILRDGRIVVAKNYRAALRARYAQSNTKFGDEPVEEEPDETGEDGVYLVVYERAR